MLERKNITRIITFLILIAFIATLFPEQLVMAALPIMDGSLNVLTYLELIRAIDPAGIWSPVFGNLTEGFTLVLDPLIEYYYLDVGSLTTDEPLSEQLHPFILETDNLPIDFYPYWEERNVFEGCTGTWEPTMWEIIIGNAPMFYLKFDGTGYDLIDGLLYLLPESSIEAPLRINGVYPLGDYSFTGTMTNASEITEEMYVNIRFTSYLRMDELNLLGSDDLSTWTTVFGNLTDGYTMLIDEDIDTFEYLDVDSLAVNNPLSDGLYPFILNTSSLPLIFYDYWAAKGVVSGATGWMGVMWEIINGNAPMFYLKVDDTSYNLVDGLLYLISSDPANPDEEPLRISEDYPLGSYQFSGQLADIYGTTADVSVQITFVESPLAFDQDVKTYIETPEDITLGAVGEGSITWWRSDPSHGQISGSNPNITYKPDVGYTGPDSFTFYIVDASGSSNIATISIMVYNRPSIDSDNLSEAFLINENREFNVRLQNPVDGDTFSNILVKFSIAGASIDDVISFEHLETSVEPNQWQILPLREVNGTLVGVFSLAEGFPMGTEYDVTSFYRVTFGTLGSFQITLEVFDLETDPNRLLTSYTTTINILVPFEVTDIDLDFSTDLEEWFDVPKPETNFEMRLEQTEAWYYIDAVSITANRPVATGFYPFYIDVNNLPEGFYEYWAGRNVYEGTTGGWEPLMWEIITGEAPIFYLEITNVDLTIIDGLLFAIDESKEYLRFEGTYWPGVYTFVGSVKDEYGLSEELVVAMFLNDRPYVESQEVTTNEDVELTIELTVVDNYPDPDGLSLIVSTNDQPNHGSLEIIDVRTVIYTPDENYNGADYFYFRVSDGLIRSRTAAVFINITPVNDPPEALIQSVYTALNTPIDILLEGDDVDEDTLAYSVLEPPSNGIIDELLPDVTYTPNENFVGWDSFAFQVSDGEFTDTAIVTIYVGDFYYFMPLINH